MLVSAVLSIHNRSALFARALPGYLWQTLPKAEWEIILVDDCSTEDLSRIYQPYVGQINLRHVEFDHRRHPLWQARNPKWEPGKAEDWYHTPSLTINAGIQLARGSIICLCHPEILHAPGNFEQAVHCLDRLGRKQYLFGCTYLGTQAHNTWLDRNPWYERGGWDGFLRQIRHTSLRRFGPTELYWYTSFLPKAACEAVRGVDFEFLKGVAGEDDDFRDRVHRAGWAATYDQAIQGFHQDHSHESEPHRLRHTREWQKGLNHNRALYYKRKNEGCYPQPANANVDWTAQECIANVREYAL